MPVGSNTPGAASSAADFGGISDGFWEGFGRSKFMIFPIFSKKMEAKNELIFGRLKNRILRPQKQTADEVRRSVRVRGKEYRMGGMHLNEESEA